MSHIRPNNETYEYSLFKSLNNTTIKRPTISRHFQKIGYYFLIFIFIFFIFITVGIVILLIRRQILKFMEKMRRIRLQNEINKIMMIDIFETRSPSIDSGTSDFHSINNDSILSDISNSSSRSVLSEINIHNEVNNKKNEKNI